MVDRNIDRIGGLVIFSVAFALYAYNWILIVGRQYYYPKAMCFAAAMSIVGLALIIFPSYRRERVERGENIEELEGMKLLTRRWWTILIVALVFGIANWIYVEFFLGNA